MLNRSLHSLVTPPFWRRFDDLDWIGWFDVGGPDLHVSNSYLATNKQVFSIMLAAERSWGMDEVVIRNKVSPYLGPDDGFYRAICPVASKYLKTAMKPKRFKAKKR